MARPPEGAVMVGWHEDGDDLDRMKAHETDLGKRFAIVRLYNSWRLPGRRVDQMVAEGRLVISSHKPPDRGWGRIASGREDDMIRSLARKYRDYDREVIFSFHHEPHDDARDVKRSGRYGTSQEFKAAWRRIHRIFTEERAHVGAGGKVSLAYIATGSQALAGRPAGSDDKLYPGGDVVDLLAHDRYNWSGCRPDRWESFEENWAPLVALAEAQGKQIIPGEFGTPPSGGRRNEWFRDAARWIRSDPKARQWMVGFAYYHSYHDDCHWDFMNQGSDGKVGWTEGFVQDAYFTGTPFSVSAFASPDGPPAPGSAPAPAPGAGPETRDPADVVLAAAGDVACDPSDRDFRNGKGTRDRCRQAATGRLLTDLNPDAVAALGDLQYEDGDKGKWEKSFHSGWGHMKDRMRPVPGNHEYRTKDARPYYEYFGAAAGAPGKGWYSYDLGTWHVIALNSNCEDVKGLCGPRSEQMRWLAADLAANPARCTLAYWHHPRWSSGKYGSDETVGPFMELLHEAGAEVVLAGHAHSYERFSPKDPSGRPDPRGIRTFVAGTGGKSHAGFKKVLPGSEFRDDDTFGILELTLRDGSYGWRLVAERDGRPVDTGEGACH